MTNETTDATTDPLEINSRRNMLFNITGEGFWGYLAGLTASATVLVVMLKKSGASDLLIGSVAAIESAGFIFPQLIGNLLFKSRASRKRNLVLWHFSFPIPALFAMAALCWFSPQLSPLAFRWLAVAIFAVHIFSIGFIISLWMDWLSSIFSVRMRGTAFGLGFGTAQLLNFAGGLTAGALLSRDSSLATYSMLYWVAGIVGVISISIFMLIRDPADPGVSDIPPQRETVVTFSKMLGLFRQSLSDPNFRRFLFGRVLASAGFCVTPFIAAHFMAVENGGLTESKIISYGASMAVGAAVTNSLFGWIGDRRGHRIGVISGATLQTLTLLSLLTLSGSAGCIIAYVGVGLCNGAGFVSYYNMLFETCPHHHRLSHITVANLTTSIGAVFPMIAGAIVETFGFRPLLIGSLCLSAVALVWYALAVKEPRVLKVAALKG